MSEQTYLSLHSVSPTEITNSSISSILSYLRVKGEVRVSRYEGPSDDWKIFKAPWKEYPDYEVLGQIVPVGIAHEFFLPGKFLLISCIIGNSEDLRARIVDFAHKEFPDEVRRDFYLNNLSVKFGPHDIFEALENSSGTLFAQTNVSISIWGYRHPSDLATFRETLLSSDIVKKAQTELAEILGQQVEAVVYLA